MATIYTHAAVGLGLGKLFTSRPMPWSFWALAAALPVLPDLDAFSACPYGAMCGHRGFTHSLLFGVAIAAVAAPISFRHFQMRFWPLAGILFAITASHAVLDVLTDGGFGIPLFWPVSNQRFGPCGPIHVSDLGFGFPNPWTSRSIRTELLYVWAPLALILAIVSSCRWFYDHRGRDHIRRAEK